MCATVCDPDADAGCVTPVPTCADADLFDGVCPGDPVRDRLPAFEGAVYFRGTLFLGDCGSEVLLPFWPLLQSTYYGPFDCRVSHFMFAREEEQVFFIDAFEGLKSVDDAGQRWDWPTPPCDDRPAAVRFVEGKNGSVHQCGRSLHVADGTVVADEIEELVQVNSEGRILATRYHSTGRTLVALDTSGQTHASLTPGDQASGRFMVLPDASTSTGSDSFVLWQRELDDGSQELVAYRLDGAEQWHVLRRVQTTGRGEAHMLLPDGTVLRSEQDPDDPIGQRIRVWLSDGTEAMVWLDREHEDVTTQRPNELFIGPAEPKGATLGMLDWP